MVDDIDTEELACFDESAGDIDVFTAGSERTGWVIVRHDDGVRVCKQRGFEHFSWVNQARSNGSLRHDMVADHMVLGVKMEGNEVLGVVELHRFDEPLDVIGASDRLWCRAWFLDEREPHLRNDVSKMFFQCPGVHLFSSCSRAAPRNPCGTAGEARTTGTAVNACRQAPGGRGH